MLDINDIEITLESFKLGVISRATGGDYDKADYQKIRNYLLSAPEIKHLIPTFIKMCNTPDEFWQYIKAQYGTYAERRTFLADEINPIIEYYANIRRKDDVININSDSYELGDKIGEGGYGSVYKYWHKQLETNFAIKFLEPKHIPLDEIQEYHRRFFREAKMLFLFNHDNIVKFYDTGLMGDIPFIKMEFIEGYNLYKLIEKYSLLPFDKSLVPITQLLEGLSVAHSQGVIHRDIKPTNIMFAVNSKKFKIIDFGIGAYIEHELYTKLTKTGENIAGNSYTAPELLENPELKDLRSDIYSIGAIWFYLLTGMPPKGSGLLKTLLNVGVCEAQAILILRCLDSIDDRFSSCDEVLNAIRKPESTTQSTAHNVTNMDSIELNEQEILFLGAVLQNQEIPSRGCSIWTVREAVSERGLNDIASNLASRKLISKGIIETCEEEDYRDYPYSAYKITPLGDSWVLSNEIKFEEYLSFDTEVDDNDDDDLPF